MNREGCSRASQHRANGVHNGGSTLDRYGQAFGEVCLKAGDIPKEVQEPADCGELGGIGVAEDKHIIRKERDRGSVAVSEPFEDAGHLGVLEQGVQGINHQDEKHRGYRISLPKAFAMGNRRAWGAVDQDAHRGCGYEDGYPLVPPWAEA